MTRNPSKAFKEYLLYFLVIFSSPLLLLFPLSLAGILPDTYSSTHTFLFFLLFSLSSSVLLGFFRRKFKLLTTSRTIGIVLVLESLLFLLTSLFGVECGYKSEFYPVGKSCECFGFRIARILSIAEGTPTYYCLGICHSCRTVGICLDYCSSLDYKFNSTSISQIKEELWCKFGMHLYIPSACSTVDRCYIQPLSLNCNNSTQSFSPSYPEHLKFKCAFHLATGEICDPDEIEDGWVKCCQEPTLENCNCRKGQ